MELKNKASASLPHYVHPDRIDVNNNVTIISGELAGVALDQHCSSKKRNDYIQLAIDSDSNTSLGAERKSEF